MTQDQKKEIAVFRYGVIGDFVNGCRLDRDTKARLIRDKCARRWQIPYSEKTHVSRSTLNRWIRIYNGDLKSLYPKDRSDRGQSRVPDDDTCTALVNLKRQMPAATVRQLIRQMQKKQLATPGIELSPSTVYRFLHRNGLMNRTGHKPVDRRRFEAELPNDLWQSDVMHGPKVKHDGKNRKTYLIAAVDDHSRLIVCAHFYLSENLVSYPDVLYHALAKRGLPRKLYVDNGPAFRSKKLAYITAALNITLIHASPYTPQGKGKIERWFKTVRSSFLPEYSGQTLDALNRDLGQWIDNHYHRRKHGSTGQSPFERFTQNLQCSRRAPSNLTDYFRTVARRKVAKDRTVTLNGNLYEAPVALIGKRVELLYHDVKPECVEIKFNQQSYGILEQVDLKLNCRIKRDKNCNTDLQINNKRYHGGTLFGSEKEN